MLKDPVLEARARTISAGLRCLVCQNESIDESHADLARDIRLLVRQRLEAGDTNAQIRDYLVARYGQFILLKPPFEPQTLLALGHADHRPRARVRAALLMRDAAETVPASLRVRSTRPSAGRSTRSSPSATAKNHG